MADGDKRKMYPFSMNRSSSSAATTAFAAATAGLASCADQQQKGIARYLSTGTGIYR